MKKMPKEPGDMDITPALRGWDFQPGQVNVRLIRGTDGRAKLQMRLDLGLLQMELDGRPDGKRPHKSKTELDFQRRRLTQHVSKAGNDNGFSLTPRECQALREESAMFYHRYLSLFVLEQYEAVVRDTQHNLDVLDLCHRYGRSERDRQMLEQYRPYILMMQTRAKACEALRQGYVQTAIAYLRGGIKKIVAMYRKAGKPQEARGSHEVQILLDMLRQIRRQLPPDPRVDLRKKLEAAVRDERYEDAAELRDRLLAMHHGPMSAQANPAMAGAVEEAKADAAAKPKATRTPRKPRKSPNRRPKNSEE